MEIDNELNLILSAAYREAKFRSHEYLTPEHLLYSALFFESGAAIIKGCSGDVELLKTQLSDHLKNVHPPTEKGVEEQEKFCRPLIEMLGRALDRMEPEDSCEFLRLFEIFLAEFKYEAAAADAAAEASVHDTGE